MTLFWETQNIRNILCGPDEVFLIISISTDTIHPIITFKLHPLRFNSSNELIAVSTAVPLRNSFLAKTPVC